MSRIVLPPQRLVWCILLVLLPAIALAQPPEITATSKADKKSIELSQSLIVTLTIEGPAPLRIELPRPLLVPESERDWKIQAKGPPVITPLGSRRERWIQDFRLAPFDFGKSMVVAFAPLKVNGKVVSADGIAVTVDDPRIELKPEESMSVTGIEHLQASTPRNDSQSRWWLLLLIPLFAAAIIAWRFRRTSKPLPPDRWALEAFARIEHDMVDGMAVATAVAAVIRGFIERQFGIPAPKLTTEELLSAAERADLPVDQTDPLRQLLEDCDRAKFAGDTLDNDRCRRLLARSREWVRLIYPTPRPE
jgi:hypothetical protein